MNLGQMLTYRMNPYHTLSDHLEIMKVRRLELIQLGHAFWGDDVYILRNSLSPFWASEVDELLAENGHMILDDVRPLLIEK